MITESQRQTAFNNDFYKQHFFLNNCHTLSSDKKSSSFNILMFCYSYMLPNILNRHTAVGMWIING